MKAAVGPEVVEELGDEDLTREDEAAANEFARETAVAEPRRGRVAPPNPSIDRGAHLRSSPTNQGVAPGIVVGRLQRDKRLLPGELNHLKRHFNAAP